MSYGLDLKMGRKIKTSYGVTIEKQIYQKGQNRFGNKKENVVYEKVSKENPDMAEVELPRKEADIRGEGATVRRINSEVSFYEEEKDNISSKNDPYKALERSQSEATLPWNSECDGAFDFPTSLRDFEAAHSGHNVSECTKVYFDLSRAEPYEKVQHCESTTSMKQVYSGRTLEPIPQDEELQTGDLSHIYASQRSISNDSTSSNGSGDVNDIGYNYKGVTTTKEVSTSSSSSSIKVTKTTKIQEMSKSKASVKSSFQIYAHSLKQKIRQLQMGSVPEQIIAMQEMNTLMEQAWSMPIYGREVAYGLCDILREEHAFEIIVNNCASTNRELLQASALLLEQTLTTGNRIQVADTGLETVVKMTVDTKSDNGIAETTTGILESLFKTSEETCSRVIYLGGLDVIIHWCRCSDIMILRHCAIALSNLALYGGSENQQEMTKRKVPEWLFPLAFSDDDSVRYYACLALAVLVANKEIEMSVLNSGTLELVLPFIESHSPDEFAQMDITHRHGRSTGWLKRLVPVLSSKREEAQTLAAFHFAMEAGIKAEQERRDILYDIGVIEPLKQLASSPNCTASRLAAQALKIMGEEVPKKLSKQVPLWSVEDVSHWVAQVGYGEYCERFEDCHVDGDILLQLTDLELAESLDMTCRIAQKRFLRELKDLKITADYTSCDPYKLAEWLEEISPEFAQHTYSMLSCGVDRQSLQFLTDDHLRYDCGIYNGVHRMKLLEKVRKLKKKCDGMTEIAGDITDGLESVMKTIDCFISYRRSNGSQLASLLKVHLQLRGFSVFIDIERLSAGKFDENLLKSIKLAKNFLLVLTPNALDRCIDDQESKDWVHKEIAAAIEGGCNIIPLMDNFDWPPADKLPADMKNIVFFNGIRWIHDYQDACVDKLEQFLRGEVNVRTRGKLQHMGSQGSFDLPNDVCGLNSLDNL
ncbi:NAD(+) hydrolase SARM1 isoform X3 [Patella vulgata]|uniref:NAD(+) hydrolase SARM1 isoform X3 n=1 Tax=Patella vulgata TaxID=6465 RepID=UPI00217FC521|nr:NAD(+) hydrolase SARM1 isoform X3 [Patella vulgata]